MGPPAFQSCETAQKTGSFIYILWKPEVKQNNRLVTELPVTTILTFTNFGLFVSNSSILGELLVTVPVMNKNCFQEIALHAT
jgi:hypothetical protein